MMENLASQIDALSDSDLLEAAGYYLVDRLEVQSTDEIEEMLLRYCEELDADSTALEVIRNDLMHDRDSYRKLLLLLLHTEIHGSEEQRQLLKEAIESAGQKQVVIDVFLVMSLAILATVQIMAALLLTKGREKEVKKVDIEKKPDGSIHMSIEEETTYTSSSTALGGFLSWLKTIGKGPNR
jgi:hypothetical protein